MRALAVPSDPSSGSNTVPTETSVSSAGGFDCSTTVAQGPLAGCAAGEGVRWDTAQPLASTSLTCTGSDAARPAITLWVQGVGCGTAIVHFS
jgi:hypothetical protein